MKKIVAVSVIRNENDIIESFCRYIASYCDLLLIQDDDSTDNTKSILDALILEGLPIVFSQKPIFKGYNEFSLPQSKIMNHLVDTAFNTYNADVVIPADADEFLVAADGASPRTVLEYLEDNTGFRVKWRTYIYNDAIMNNEVFLPNHFPEHRNPELEHYWKVIITRQLYNNYGCKLTTGNHNLEYPNKLKVAPMQNLLDLYIAHYPIRSVPQLSIKIINGWYSYLASPSRKNKWGYHWEKIYNEIKETGGLNSSSAREASIHYSVKEEIKHEDSAFLPIYGPLRIKFLKEGIKLKYTDYNLIHSPFWGEILDNTELLIKFIVQRQKDIASDAKVAEQELATIKSSHSWRMTKPLRIVGRVLRKYKPE